MSDAPAGLTSLQFNVLTSAGALSLVLVVANVGLSLNNREAQAQVNARQQYINDTVQLSRLNTQIVQALANLSVQTGDESIQRLLAAQGITISTEAAAASAAEPARSEEVQE
jgi:hypothetical protein